MNLLGAALVEELGGFPQLGTPDNGVVNEHQPAALNQIMHRNQLHLGNQVALALNGGHEGTGPGGGVLDKGAGEGNAGAVGVADGMGRTGVRHTGYGVCLHAVPGGQHGTALIPHLFDADALIGGRRIAIVDPQEGADLHIGAGCSQGANLLRGNNHDFAGTQLLIFGVSQVEISKGLKGDTVGVLLVADHHRRTTQPVSGGKDALGGHDQNGHGAVNHLLSIADAVNQVILLIDEGCHQFGVVQITAAHLQEMGVPVLEDVLSQLCRVVDAAHRGNRIGSVVGADQQGLGLVVGNTANAHPACHFVDVFFKLGPERRIFNVVNGTVKSLFPIHGHTCPAGSQMGVIIGSEKQIKYAILFGCHTKKTTHLTINLHIPFAGSFCFLPKPSFQHFGVFLGRHIVFPPELCGKIGGRTIAHNV